MIKDFSHILTILGEQLAAVSCWINPISPDKTFYYSTVIRLQNGFQLDFPFSLIIQRHTACRLTLWYSFNRLGGLSSPRQYKLSVKGNCIIHRSESESYNWWLIGKATIDIDICVGNKVSFTYIISIKMCTEYKYIVSCKFGFKQAQFGETEQP